MLCDSSHNSLFLMDCKNFSTKNKYSILKIVVALSLSTYRGILVNSRLNWVTFYGKVSKFCVYVMYCTEIVAMPIYN